MSRQPGPPGRDDNRHLSRACWAIVSEHKHRYGEAPTGLYFNKALSLLHKRLNDQGHDLKLPHCWYRYGDEVVRNWTPSQVFMDHDVKTTVQWIGKEPRRPTDKLGKAMAEHLEVILKEFSAQEHIEQMVDKVYEYAPFEFQRAYRQVRRAKFDSGQSHLTARNVSNVTLALVENAAQEFPRQEFRPAAFFAESAFAACTVTLENDETRLELVRESLEKFWTYWCYYLRLHPKAHENVPDSTLQLWQKELEPQEKEYAIVFLAHLAEMAQSVPELRDQEVLQPWLAQLDLSDDEAAQSIGYWTSVFSGVDAFVQEGKAGYAA